MILKVDLEDAEIQKAIQKQLDGGPTIQIYFKAALRYFNRLLACEDACKLVGDEISITHKKNHGYVDVKSQVLFPSEIFNEVGE